MQTTKSNNSAAREIGRMIEICGPSGVEIVIEGSEDHRAIIATMNQAKSIQAGERTQEVGTYFCAWCYSQGLRYPDNGKPWGHALGCPDAAKPTVSFPPSARHSMGDKVTTSGFEGRILRLCSDGPNEASRMYEVRLSSGTVCVCGSDILPA